jgi:N6-adenosine-specific RNA methylase IME4
MTMATRHFQGGLMKTGGSAFIKPLPYNLMTLEQIRTLPVRGLAAPDGARLFLWTTNRYLPEAFVVIAAWGFTYKQTLVWHKTGNPSPFGGSVAPNHAEFLLVAQRGEVPVVNRLKSSVIAVNKPTNAHSKKPDLFLDLVQQVSPGPYLELFARSQRLGWHTWGDEALKHVTLECRP